MLKIRGISSSYGSIEALKGVDMEVREGEIVSLLGANGAGKSTLLMSISGVVKVTKGGIEYLGEEIVGKEVHKIVERGIIQVPEGRRIFARLTVRENLLMGYRGSVVEERDKRFAWVIKTFSRLGERLGQRGGTLSGGEQQMLAIGRALMGGPRLLLLDEPSLGLAPLMIKEIFRILLEIRDSAGVTVLLVEQNVKQALNIAERGYILQTGQIVESGSADELRSNKKVIDAYLGE